MAQGKYTLTRDAQSGGWLAVRDPHGVCKIHRKRPADRRLAGVPADENRLPLAQLEALVVGKAYVPPPVEVRRTPQVFLPAAEGGR